MSPLWFVSLAIVVAAVAFVMWVSRRLIRHRSDLAGRVAMSKDRRQALDEVRGELSRTAGRIDDRR